MIEQPSNVPKVDGKSLYRTSDLYFSAYLASIGISMTTTEVTKSADGGKKVIFVFSAPEGDIERAKALYFGGSGTVKARAFVDSLRSLKSLCYT